MIFLFIKFFGHDFAKIYSENPIGINHQSTGAPKFGLFKGVDFVSLKPTSLTSKLNPLFKLSFQTGGNDLVIKSIHSFFFTKNQVDDFYDIPSDAHLAKIGIPQLVRTAIQNKTLLDNAEDTQTAKKNLSCLVVEFTSTTLLAASVIETALIYNKNVQYAIQNTNKAKISHNLQNATPVARLGRYSVRSGVANADDLNDMASPLLVKANNMTITVSSSVQGVAGVVTDTVINAIDTNVTSLQTAIELIVSTDDFASLENQAKKIASSLKSLESINSITYTSSCVLDPSKKPYYLECLSGEFETRVDVLEKISGAMIVSPLTTIKTCSTDHVTTADKIKKITCEFENFEKRIANIKLLKQKICLSWKKNF